MSRQTRSKKSWQVKKTVDVGKVRWGSRLGVVLAVAGSAVGLGNFLRFPGQAAANGAGAFMIPYFIALLVVGFPLAWAEWSMGRYSGVRGFHSAPGVFATICRTKWASFLGMFALLIPMMVYTYYVIIEAWCLGYAWHYLTGDLMQGSDPSKYSGFFATFTGQGAAGDALNVQQTPVLIFVGITFVLNFALIIRGLNKGIETFCKFAMPLMIICALCVLVRVLTLDTPDIDTGVNVKIYQNAVSEKPDNPERQLWLASALVRDNQNDEALKTANIGLEKLAALRAENETPQALPEIEKGLNSLIAGDPPEYPDQSVAGGLNFMWNPDFTKLKEPGTWLAAVGQIFFSLSVGFGVIINYSSYLRKKDDVALSALTAGTTNEFFEVCLGGLITLPAAFIFMGLAAGTFGTFSLGFTALPNVFAMMPGGRIFGFLWFFMLFLAAITSSLSMLQPVGAFFEEGLGVKRIGSSMLLGLIAAGGCSFVVYFSKDLVALDTIDFWCGTYLIAVLALAQSIIYGWVFGTKRGKEEMDRGGVDSSPWFVQYILKYVTPVFIAVILVGTTLNSSGDYIKNFQTNEVARNAVFVILAAATFLLITIAIANARWKRQGKFDSFGKDK